MKNVLAGCLLLFSFSSMAEVTLEHVWRLSRLYYRLGDDNNNVDAAMMFSDEFAKHKGTAKEVAGEALVDSVKKCVFMAKGIYGDHLRPEMHDRMSRLIAKMISSLKNYEIEDYQVGSGVLNAPCVLAIEDPSRGRVLMMQGAAND